MTIKALIVLGVFLGALVIAGTIIYADYIVRYRKDLL